MEPAGRDDIALAGINSGIKTAGSAAHKEAALKSSMAYTKTSLRISERIASMCLYKLRREDNLFIFSNSCLHILLLIGILSGAE